jgi:hypothetical protein
MPFASGRRNCVGQSLALLELKIVVATLFYSYDFEIISVCLYMYVCMYVCIHIYTYIFIHIYIYLNT